MINLEADDTKKEEMGFLVKSVEFLFPMDGVSRYSILPRIRRTVTLGSLLYNMIIKHGLH